VKIHLRLKIPLRLRRRQDGVEPPLLPRELAQELSEMSTDLRKEYEEELIEYHRPRREEEAYTYAYIMA